MTESRIEGFVAVVPAGGVGSRLWPLSRPERPKFLLDLLGTGETLLQATLARLAPLTDNVLVVTGERHAAAVAAQAPGLAPNAVLAEPSPRDSMAAIALAAAVIEHRHGPRIMGSFAADHVIPDAAAFRAAVRRAAGAARDGLVVTVGIKPTEPSSAFGYIESGDAYSDGVRRVRAFTEKPDAETAARMIATGDFVWNAGMYVVRTDVLLGHLARLLPPLEQGVRRIAAAWDGPERAAVLAEVWPTLTRIAIDHAIAEPVAAEGSVAVVPAAFEWHDVGDFASLADLAVPDADGTTRVGSPGHVVTVDAANAVVVGSARTVAIVGLDDVVVVDSEDALLVVRRGAAQAVKDVADRA